MYVVPGSMLTPALRIVRPLSEGAVGNLWIGEDLAQGTELAVKFLSEDMVRLSSEAIKRFRREAQAAIRLVHPHIIRTFEFGQMDDGTPYIVMELLAGESLGQRLERAGPLGAVDVARIVAQVAEALHAAHELDLVHRDVKPDNIFLVAGHAEPFVKVLDFGTVKQIRQRSDSLLTATGMIVGTPEYMSPEQVFASKDVDHRADLWGLGAVAYHALTGRLPFEGDSPHALVLAIANGEHTPPSAVDRRLSAEVDGWFARALARSPGDRFESAPQMAAAFATAVGATADSLVISDPSTEDLTLPFQPGMGPDGVDPQSNRGPSSHGAPGAPAGPLPSASTPPAVTAAGAAPLSATLPPQSAPPTSAEAGLPSPPPESAGQGPVPSARASVENALLAATQPGAIVVGPIWQQRAAARRRRLAVLAGTVLGAVTVVTAIIVVALVASADRTAAPPTEPMASDSASAPGDEEARGAGAQAAASATAAASAEHGDDQPPVGSAGGAPSASVSGSGGPPGYVTVLCEPPCDQVVARGRALGPSPVFRAALPPGRHEITLQRAGRPNRTIEVEVVSGQLSTHRDAANAVGD